MNTCLNLLDVIVIGIVKTSWPKLGAFDEVTEVDDGPTWPPNIATQSTHYNVAIPTHMHIMTVWCFISTRVAIVWSSKIPLLKMMYSTVK